MEHNPDHIVRALKGEEPKEGQRWWILLPGDQELTCVKIYQLTEKIVIMRRGPTAADIVYKKYDVEFVEKFIIREN